MANKTLQRTRTSRAAERNRWATANPEREENMSVNREASQGLSFGVRGALARFVLGKPLLAVALLLIARLALDLATSLRTFPLGYLMHDPILVALYSADVLIFGAAQAAMYLLMVSGPLLHWYPGCFGWPLAIGAFLTAGLLPAALVVGAIRRWPLYYVPLATVFVVIALFAKIAPPSILITGWFFALGAATMVARYTERPTWRLPSLVTAVAVMAVCNLFSGFYVLPALIPTR